ncbi:MAG TPA: beta-galactosidase [bacterium]|nr:beta-galactosidase [bacterium]HPN43586.1 beta-galactosidase [bacterium]
MAQFKKMFAGVLLFFTVMMLSLCVKSNQTQVWKPLADWGHWRLGQKADLEFLQKNHFTVTFGSGAPSVEDVTREEFDKKIAEAKEFNKSYHDQGYIVLRYLSTSLNGTSESNKDIPTKEQIKMLKFYNENWNDFQDYIGPKPEQDPTTWITVYPDGTFPFYRYAPYGKETGSGFETWGCPNNPYYNRMMEGRIRAQAETGIDGSYVDWTQIAGGTCYCSYCQEAFVKYLKDTLPIAAAQAKYNVADYQSVKPPQKRGEPFWMEWLKFRGYSVAEFHKRLRTAARQANPNFMIAGNVFGGFGYGPIACDAAGNMEYLGKEGYDDFIYSEMQEFLDSAPRKNEEGVKITNSPALKFLSAASHGKPVIIYATEITPPIFPDPTEKCLSAMAQINIAEAVANHTIFREKRETPPGATAVYQFLAENETNLVGAQLTGNIAVVASLNQYLAGELSFAFSASRVLADRGIAHVMIIEDDLLTAKINDFDLIVLPYLPLLSLQKQAALQKYVENGGRVLILGECGQKDENNVAQQENLLAKMLGVEKYPDTVIEKAIQKGQVSFMPLPIPESRFLIAMKSKGEYTTFGPTMADLFADIPEGYTRNRIDPQLRAALEALADKIISVFDGKLTCLPEKSPYVEMTTMVNKDMSKMLVHFVNYDVTLDGTITPATDVAVNLLAPKGKHIKQIQYSGELAALNQVQYNVISEQPQQLVMFELDNLNVYGLAVVSLE